MENVGVLNTQFYSLISRDKEAFSKLSSESKVFYYRSNGALIGENVTFSCGSIVLSKSIRIENDVTIGENVQIQSDVLKIGELSYLGKNTSIVARRVEIGQNVFFSKDIEIGGGGARDPESEIIIHSHTHIGQEVHLNCCRKIEIGEESTISIGTMIMTHCFANSILEGYPTLFAPVSIGKSVQIGLRCTIFPGVTIEDGSVIGSNSNVLSKITKESYACGVPAKILGPAKKQLSKTRIHSIALQILKDFSSQLKLLGISIEENILPNQIILTTVGFKEKKYTLLFSEVKNRENLVIIKNNLHHYDEIVWLYLEEDLTPESFNFSEIKITFLNLLAKKISGNSCKQGKLQNTVREFLRKRGIRFEPRTWTYNPSEGMI